LVKRVSVDRLVASDRIAVAWLATFGWSTMNSSNLVAVRRRGFATAAASNGSPVGGNLCWRHAAGASADRYVDPQYCVKQAIPRTVTCRNPNTHSSIAYLPRLQPGTCKSAFGLTWCTN